jgi:hypothetical protein
VLQDESILLARCSQTIGDEVMNTTKRKSVTGSSCPATSALLDRPVSGRAAANPRRAT